MKTERSFIRYYGGKCYNQPVSKNIIAKIACKIAKYLNLDNPKAYTGLELSEYWSRISHTKEARVGSLVVLWKPT